MRKSRGCRYENFKLRTSNFRETSNIKVRTSFWRPFGIWDLEFVWSLEFGVCSFPRMRLGTVIGRVTLSVTVPALEGGRWLIVSPFTREHFQHGSETPAGMSKDPSLVVYDALGGALGQTIGFSEGREAAQPFDQPPPIDAV